MSETDNVERVDFGKGHRESARKLAGLLKLVTDLDADMLRDPKRYFDMAGEEIVRLRRLIEAAREAGQRPFNFSPIVSTEPSPMPFDTIYVDRAEFERLRAMADIINAEPPS